MANDPASIPAREVLLGEAEALTDRFHFLAQRGAEIADGVNRDIAGTVADINTLAKGIADLNQVIVESGGLTGQPPNDLLDQRDQLINELSSLVKVTYYEQNDGAVNVFIGNGQSLVVGAKAARLSVGLNATQPVVYYNDDAGMQDITAQINGGQLGGLLQFRTQVLDASMARLDVIADTLATAMNDQHRLGRDLSGALGGDFFTLGGAANIELNLTDARQIAAASGTLPFNSADNGNALALAELQRDKAAFGGTTVQGAYAQIVADIGSRTRTAELNATAQRGLLSQAEEAHSAVSGVNLDEEAAKLMHYQQAYQAAAQAIAIGQKLFETIIAAMQR